MATALRKAITGSGFPTMSECQSSLTIKTAGRSGLPFPLWKDSRNLRAASDHSVISVTRGSEAGTIAMPSSPRVNSERDPSRALKLRFGSVKASRQSGCAMADSASPVRRATLQSAHPRAKHPRVSLGRRGEPLWLDRHVARFSASVIPNPASSQPRVDPWLERQRSRNPRILDIRRYSFVTSRHCGHVKVVS